MSDSTILVDSKTPYFAAEVYKSYLICAARIVKIAFGAITAYDGDRIMAVFIGNDKEERAVRSALRINYATSHIINPAIEAQYGAGMYTLRQVVGIDTSEIVAARIGVRKYNDLVWVGHAANHAAKLSGLSDYPTYITAAVHSQLPTSLTNVGGKDVWEARFWTPMNNERIYRSNWHCALT
jgi:class 3 adenylate cyclase